MKFSNEFLAGLVLGGLSILLGVWLGVHVPATSATPSYAIPDTVNFEGHRYVCIDCAVGLGK